MDGSSRALGVGPTITMQGETFPIKGRVLNKYALIEAEIIKMRPNPIEMMRELGKQLKDDPVLLRSMVAEMMQSAKGWAIVTGTEIRDWLSTMRGRCFLCWLAVEHNDPQRLTLEKVTQLFLDELEDQTRAGGEEARLRKIKELEDAVDQASGEDELGNSNGSAPTEAMAGAASTGLGSSVN